ncbi:MAG: DUF5989 family protein [Deltaproteobacteria bacterium]|nr:DUF5989 family protein [Deltaproteobacteria bacterium]
MPPSSQPGTVRRLLRALNEDKLYWITPIVLLLVGLGVFLFFVEGSALAPIIYAVF